VPRPFPPKTCLCGEKLWSLKAKIRHQEECVRPRLEKARRDAAAASIDLESWQR